MRRREFFKAGAAGVAATAATIAAPAVAQSKPEIKWRLTSSFPRSLDLTWAATELLAKYVGEFTDQRFTIQTFAAGEIVPGLQVLDSVSNGAVEAGYSPSLFYIGKDPAFAVGTTIPFGMNPRQQHAWMYHEAGNKLLNDFYAKYKVHALPCGNTGNQMGGWFRKEINTFEDFAGLKMRVAGLQGYVLAKAGVVPQQLAPGDIYPALERGVIDAVEYIGPHDDEKLGFSKVAKYYYYPGWGEGGAVFHAFFNLDKWNELPKSYQLALQAASQAVTTMMLAHYDAKNPEAISRLVSNGTQLKSFSADIIDKLYKASHTVYDELSAKSPDFKTLKDAYFQFRDRSYSYHQVADFSFDLMMLQLRRGKAG